MAKKRKKRNCELTCTCKAYSFPHRLFGGKCKILNFVYKYWANHHGSGDCKDCNCYVMGECQVDNGQESAKEAECLQEFIRLEEVRVYFHRRIK